MQQQKLKQREKRKELKIWKRLGERGGYLLWPRRWRLKLNADFFSFHALNFDAIFCINLCLFVSVACCILRNYNLGLRRFSFFFFTILLQFHSEIHIQISKNVKHLLGMRTKAPFFGILNHMKYLFILRVSHWLSDLFSSPWGHPLVGLGVFLGPFIRILKVEWEYLYLLDVLATKNLLDVFTTKNKGTWWISHFTLFCILCIYSFLQFSLRSALSSKLTSSKFNISSFCFKIHNYHVNLKNRS